MKRLVAAPLLLASACVIGPKLVSVPMLESAPVVPRAPTEVAETPEPEDAPNLSGTWTGTAYQHAGGRSWPISVTFEAARGTELAAHAYYADQHCRADWKLHATDGRHWQGEEVVTVDPFRRCPDRGRVNVDVVDEDTLSWRWARQGDTATANLERLQKGSGE